MCYRNLASSKHAAISGIAQGSNLGPLVFLVFISCIRLCMRSQILVYVDDVKLRSTIDTPTESSTVAGAERIDRRRSGQVVPKRITLSFHLLIRLRIMEWGFSRFQTLSFQLLDIEA
ncbi:hypothetical protein Trydic_g20121 [Trypoxylus dichotomus]